MKYPSSRRNACLLLLASLSLKQLAPNASAQVVSPVQSSADPMKLSITGPVMAAGTDASSAKFQTIREDARLKFAESRRRPSLRMNA